MTVLLLSGADVKKLISIRETIEAVEEAFLAKGLGKAQMPPKSYVFFNRYEGDFRVMPAYLEDTEAAGVKIVNVHPQNPSKYSMPTVMATIVLLDPRTGAPLAIMDGTTITNVRTGAAGAVAAKYLAQKDSRVVALIGAGAQAMTQFLALNEIFKIEELRVSDKVEANAKKYASEVKKRFDISIKVTDAKEAVQGADIIVTTTPVKSPIVMNDWVSEGVHINAIGADAPGKQLLDPEILKRAKIIIDNWEQASHSGEINVPLSKGMLAREDMHAELGEIVSGKKSGRTSRDEITVFDSTGLAIQDVATAWLVYKKAKEIDMGTKVELL
ncbi:Delta(1)-pyrroline-2-carboxylate reductase [subsurface metagenome]